LGQIFIEEWNKAATPANITAGFVPLASSPSIPRLFRTKPSLPVLYHTVRTLKSPKLWQWLTRQLLLLCHTRRLASRYCAWCVWQSCVANKRNLDMLSSGKDDDADTERKANMAPSQETQNINRS